MEGVVSGEQREDVTVSSQAYAPKRIQTWRVTALVAQKALTANHCAERAVSWREPRHTHEEKRGVQRGVRAPQLSLFHRRRVKLSVHPRARASKEISDRIVARFIQFIA